MILVQCYYLVSKNRHNVILAFSHKISAKIQFDHLKQSLFFQCTLANLRQGSVPIYLY